MAGVQPASIGLAYRDFQRHYGVAGNVDSGDEAALPYAMSTRLPSNAQSRAELHRALCGDRPLQAGVPLQLACILVDNSDVSVDSEWAHLCRLPAQHSLERQLLDIGFLRLPSGPCTLRWERNNGTTRYTLLRALPPSTLINDDPQDLLPQLMPPGHWVQQIPGATLAAWHLVMLIGEPPNAAARAAAYEHWFPDASALASQIGIPTHSAIVTDLQLRTDGWQRLLVLCAPGTPEARVGRVAQRLLDIVTHQILGLTALQPSQDLQSSLLLWEHQLIELSNYDCATAANTLQRLSADIERARLTHLNRAQIARGHAKTVDVRLDALAERPIPGSQTLGQFWLSRWGPAHHDIKTTSSRLEALALQLHRSQALLDNRISVAAEHHRVKALRWQISGWKLQATLLVMATAAAAGAVAAGIAYLAHLPVAHSIAAYVFVSGACCAAGLVRTARRLAELRA